MARAWRSAVCGAIIAIGVSVCLSMPYANAESAMQALHTGILTVIPAGNFAGATDTEHVVPALFQGPEADMLLGSCFELQDVASASLLIRVRVVESIRDSNSDLRALGQFIVSLATQKTQMAMISFREVGCDAPLSAWKPSVGSTRQHMQFISTRQRSLLQNPDLPQQRGSASGRPQATTATPSATQSTATPVPVTPQSSGNPDLSQKRSSQQSSVYTPNVNNGGLQTATPLPPSLPQPQGGFLASLLGSLGKGRRFLLQNPDLPQQRGPAPAKTPEAASPVASQTIASPEAVPSQSTISPISLPSLPTGSPISLPPQPAGNPTLPDQSPTSSPAPATASPTASQQSPSTRPPGGLPHPQGGFLASLLGSLGKGRRFLLQNPDLPQQRGPAPAKTPEAASPVASQTIASPEAVPTAGQQSPGTRPPGGLPQPQGGFLASLLGSLGKGRRSLLQSSLLSRLPVRVYYAGGSNPSPPSPPSPSPPRPSVDSSRVQQLVVPDNLPQAQKDILSALLDAFGKRRSLLQNPDLPQQRNSAGTQPAAMPGAIPSQASNLPQQPSAQKNTGASSPTSLPTAGQQDPGTALPSLAGLPVPGNLPQNPKDILATVLAALNKQQKPGNS